MKTYIIATGSELTSGKSIDTNSKWISEELSSLGFKIEKISILPDDFELIKNEISSIMAIDEKKILILTGGLGPTGDDYTLNVVLSITGKKSYQIEYAYNKLVEISKKRGKSFEDILPMTSRQTNVPDGCFVLQNEVGIAPGFYLELNPNTHFVAMPGVPNEMKPMFTNKLLPEIMKKFAISEIYYDYRYIWTYSESVFQNEFIQTNQDLIGKGIDWGVTARAGYIKVTFISKDKNLHTEIMKRLDTKYVHNSTKDIFEEIHNLLTDSIKSLATAESCTGGLISKIITDVGGSSSYFIGSVVSYSNYVKQALLKVTLETLEEHGAVSEETAREMVIGLEKLYNADYNISVTGIAGPGGESGSKKVGLVYIGIKSKHHEPRIYKYEYTRFSRESVREYAANTALYLLYKEIKHTLHNPMM